VGMERRVRRAEKQRVPKPRSLLHDAMRRLIRNKAAIVGGFLVFSLVVLAIGANWIAPYGYTDGHVRDNYMAANASHLIGCDFMGRDVLSRLIYGARVSLAAAFVGALTSFLIGVIYGLVSGYFGGKTDNGMMRFVDIMFAFPTLLLIILLMVYFKSTFSVIEPGTFRGFLSSLDRSMGGMLFIFIGIGITSWLGMARLIRAMTLSVREKEYMEAARAIGASGPRLIFHHIFPNILGPAIVSQALQIPGFILYEAFLSFIGLGVNPPTPSWGAMLNEGYIGMRSHFNLVLWPAIAISVTLFAFNFLGDGVRDAFDPRQTR